MTGDLIDMSLSDLPAVLDMLNRLDPRQGIVVCEGNHDLYDSRHAFEHRTRAAGLRLLVDESCLIDFRGSPVQFLGLKWQEGGDRKIAESFATVHKQVNPDAFPILLAHHPHAFDPAAAAGIPLTSPATPTADSSCSPTASAAARCHSATVGLVPQAQCLARGLQRGRRLVPPAHQRPGGNYSHHATLAGLTASYPNCGNAARRSPPG